jgi:hypothetical protein
MRDKPSIVKLYRLECRIPMLEVSPTTNDDERKKKLIENKSMKLPKRWTLKAQVLTVRAVP